MSSANPSEENHPVLVHIAPAKVVFYSLEAAAELADVHPEIVLHYCELGLLGDAYVQRHSQSVFDDNAVYELRRIEHYRRHHGINRQALPLVIGLLREVERLQAEVRFHRTR